MWHDNNIKRIAFLFQQQKRFPRRCFSTTVQRFESSTFCYVWLSHAKILFLQFLTLCSIIEHDFERPSLRKYSFGKRKECSNIKWANMTLSKQQPAGEVAKKTLSLDEKVRFLDLIHTSGTRDVALLIIIQMDQCWKTRQRQSKKTWGMLPWRL